MKPTLCLNMIVKNESKVIERCLDSVREIIDYWVISDTGSTDGTQDIIRNYFRQHQIDGILLEHEWQDFSHNRNLALESARGKADYILLMDADDYFVNQENFRLPNEADCYMVEQRYSGLKYFNSKLIRASLPWRWVGVLHEYLDCDEPYSSENLHGDFHISSTTEGARSSNPNKYLDDAKVLTKALADEPDNARYRFYLAQSYRDYGDPASALEHYQKRVEMGGWAEEVWYSLLQVALLKERLDYPDDEVIKSYLKAYEYRPRRAESLYHLARYLREQERYDLAYIYASQAASTPMNDDILFVIPSIYQWQAKDELAVCAYWTGHYQQCRQLCDEILSNPALPNGARGRIQDNLHYATERLTEQP